MSYKTGLLGSNLNADWGNMNASVYSNLSNGYAIMAQSQYTGNGHQQAPRVVQAVYDPGMAEAWKIHEQYLNDFLTGKMSQVKELSADEKMIVRALKNEKTPSEIAMLVVVARLTQRTPATVMEILDDVSKLVNEKLEEKTLSSLGAGKAVAAG